MDPNIEFRRLTFKEISLQSRRFDEIHEDIRNGNLTAKNVMMMIDYSQFSVSKLSIVYDYVIELLDEIVKKYRMRLIAEIIMDVHLLDSYYFFKVDEKYKRRDIADVIKECEIAEIIKEIVMQTQCCNHGMSVDLLSLFNGDSNDIIKILLKKLKVYMDNIKEIKFDRVALHMFYFQYKSILNSVYMSYNYHEKVQKIKSMSDRERDLKIHIKKLKDMIPTEKID